MTQADVIGAVRTACAAAATTYLDHQDVPESAPERYVVLHYITGSPGRATFDERPKTRLVQVTCWSRVSRYDAMTLQDDISTRLIQAGFREGLDRDLGQDDGYWGQQTDWRTP